MERELVLQDSIQDIALGLSLTAIFSLSLSNKYLQDTIESDAFWARWVSLNIIPRHDNDVISDISGPRPWRYYQQLHGKIGGDAIREGRFPIVDLKEKKDRYITVARSVPLYEATPIFYIEGGRLFYVDTAQLRGRPGVWSVSSAPRIVTFKTPSLRNKALPEKKNELILLSERGEIWILTTNDRSMRMSEFNHYDDEMDYWVEMDLTAHAKKISPPFPGKAVDVALSSEYALALDQRGCLFALDRTRSGEEWKLLDKGPFLALEVGEFNFEGGTDCLVLLIDIDKKLSAQYVTDIGIGGNILPEPEDTILESRHQGIVYVSVETRIGKTLSIVAVGDGYSRKNLFTFSFDHEKVTAKQQRETGVRRLISSGIISNVDGKISVGLGNHFMGLQRIQRELNDVFVLYPITRYVYLTLSKKAS